MHDVFSVYLLDSCVSNDCLMSVFLQLNVAEQRVVLGNVILVNGCRMSFMSACTHIIVLLFLILSLVYLAACCTE